MHHIQPCLNEAHDGFIRADVLSVSKLLNLWFNGRGNLKVHDDYLSQIVLPQYYNFRRHLSRGESVHPDMDGGRSGYAGAADLAVACSSSPVFLPLLPSLF